MANTTAKSYWNTQLADGSYISIDTFAWLPKGSDEGEADVSIISGDSSWSEKRKGTVFVQRGVRYEFGRIGDRETYPIVMVSVRSLNGDVVGRGKSIKKAIEDYGSQVAKLVVEQRRRAALVEGAAKLSNGEAVTVTLTRDQALAIRNALTLTAARYTTKPQYDEARKVIDAALTR